jgi:hypothetical protein
LDSIQGKPWNPTAEQFAAYKAREIELAMHNISLVKKSLLNNNSERLTVHSDDTLHSLMTYVDAIRILANTHPNVFYFERQDSIHY